MGDDPSVYLSPPDASLLEDAKSGDVITNSTNQMLDVVNDKRQRKGNRRQNNNNNNQRRQRQRNNNNNQNDGTSFDDNNPINVISALNRTSKIYNKLRKNDAVKVIDTPSGRAGFVYQSSSNSNSNSNPDFPIGPSVKESNSNWEDSYSQNQFVNRNANDVKMVPDDTSNKKIMPVLTSDGKIALVVRGDTSRSFDESQTNGSGNSVSAKKYEPITNLTSIITALNSNNDNNVNNKQNDSINLGDGLEQIKTIQEQNRLINRLDEFLASVTNKVKHIEEVVEHELGIDEEDHGELEDETTTPSTTTTTTTEASWDEDDHKKHVLQINRPLSEVLGLPKKTHYHHPNDPLHTTTEMPFIRQTTEVRRINTPHKPVTHLEPVLTTTESAEEFDHESPEVINIAVIPGFDSEMEERLFGKGQKNLDRDTNEIPETSGAMSSIHCAMQLMVALACACTVFGVLGAYYKVEIVNQVRVLYW